MNNILRNILYAVWALALCTITSGCSDDDTGDDNPNPGIANVDNPKEGQNISYYGETITVSFTASAAWSADLSTSEDETWVRIAAQNNNSAAGKGSVRLVFEKNTDTERSVELFVTVDGYRRTSLCTFTQDANSSSEISSYLNQKMHERLLTDYLWNDAYKELSDKGDIEFDIEFDDFLYTNLTKLGETNIEDGGYYREYSSLYGQRYIYSYLEEINGTASASVAASQTRAAAMSGLGMGPTLAMGYTSNETRCLILGYVYFGSPADNAGLQRGDLIVGVNGNKLDASNYQRYQQELYTATSGTYNLTYARYQDDGITLVEHSTTVTATSFAYHPIIFTGLFQNEDHSVNIGYMVLESFDLSDQESLTTQLNTFQQEGIKDLILDLRFNPGGAVAQCRYLMSSIVGAEHYDATFAKMTFNDGSTEIWSFGYGNPSQSDGLGQGPDLKLTRLYVICSENTGSAAEMVINSLRGIDFPVTTYGSRTEGKNVGMVTSQLTYNGRRFEYAPITFYVKNAKDFGDYADGFGVDKMVNNQNTDWNDDIDRYFPYGTGDWELALRADPCVIWAVQNIMDGTDPDFGTSSATATVRRTRSNDVMQPVPNVPIRPKMGRFGSIIYGPNEE